MRKRRVSIMLDDDILGGIDQEVVRINRQMGFDFTNRSKLIEERIVRKRRGSLVF